MRIIMAYTFTAAVAPVALLAACAGGSPTASTVIPASLQSMKPAHAIVPRDLYIADFNTNAVDVLHNKTYRDAGVITSGINDPTAVFLDRRGNLYVANSLGPNVTEYAPGNTSAPSFTYSSGMSRPYGVAADAHGNVYEADIGGTINEYFQGNNAVVASCTLAGQFDGVAVDSSNDVFVSYTNTNLTAELGEYVGGLKGCNLTTLLVFPANVPGGIALDKNGDLLAAQGSTVDVIDPPYTNITGTIGSGFLYALSVTLNEKNTLAFVTDVDYETVTVVSYPGGSNVTVLGSGNGLSAPTAAVDWPNAVY